MYSKTFIICLCVCVGFATETSYFEILNDVQSKISVVPKLRSARMDVSQIFTQIGEALTLETFATFLSELEAKFGSEDNITICINNLTTIFTSALSGESWSLQVLDAFGKLQSGILMLDHASPGFYDECKSIGKNSLGEIPHNVTFVSQYCTLNVMGKMGSLPLQYSYGLCIPDTCSELDLDYIVYEALKLLPLNISLTPYVLCQKNHLEFDGKAVAAMVFAGFFVLLIMISTILDILMMWMGNNSMFETKSTSANGVPHYAHKISNEETPLLGSPTTNVAEINPKPGYLMKFFLAFSVYSNGKKLLSTKKTAGTLGAVNGVRVFSMSWVILGHVFAFGLGIIGDIGYYFPLVLKRRSYQAILNAFVSVDSFFVLSGLLVAYLLLKELRRNEGKKINWIAFIAKFYFHRYWSSKWIGGIIGTTFLFGSWVATGIISNYFKLPASQLEQLADQQSMGTHYFNEYYIKPYCRIGPYLMGILFGYLLYKTDCKLKMNKVLNVFIWMVAITLGCLIVYGLYDDINGTVHLSQNVKDLYNTTHRTVWGACVGWVVFACATGNGGFINTLLSWSFFTPLARLTYFAYLVHPILIYGYYYSLRTPLYIDDLTVAVVFTALMVFTYMAAFVLSLAFEAPMLGLEKIMFNRGTPIDKINAAPKSNHNEQ
ncbi:nose resistant to fluoxetine protein 6-like isoform X2 [Ostrea edulis]|uniref:nose resistant to fluoxetine protein 6-like isoform X2 n=1 Tax=Ostrea edulis TaxID=37623 RepID=UPI00209574ED|nr:nose resistant to fluoxetine protein 6-like isoform X2 [Ostrea edulis]